MSDEATSADTTAVPVKRAGWMRRMYNWTIAWADTRYGFAALAILAFAESSFFPIPPDVLLIAMAFAAPKKWVRIAGVCTVFSVLGGVFGWYIGHGFWGLTQNFFFDYVPGFTPELFAKVSGLYGDNAFLAILGAALTPIPYKIFTIAAGVCDISIPTLIIASIIGRGGRFFLVAAIIRILGPKAKAFIEKYFNTLVWAFFLLLVAGFVAVKYAFPHNEAASQAPQTQNAPAQSASVSQ